MKRLGIGALLLIISWTAYSQTSNKILVERKKLEILLDYYFYDGPACQRSLMASDSLNSIYKLSLAYSDSLNQIKATKIELQGLQLNTWEQRYNNIVAKYDEAITHLKRKNLKLALLAIGEAVLLVLLVL